MRTLASAALGGLLLTLLAAGAGSEALAQSTARLPASRGATATDVVIPIQLDAADGVTAMDFAFDYDASVAMPTGVYRTAYTDSFALTADLATPGQVELSLSAGMPLAGSGQVAWILFHVVGTGGSTALTWFSCQLNGGARPCTTQNGSLTVGTAFAIVAVADDAGSGPGTALSVPISATSVTGVEAIDLTLTFNPTILSATGVARAPLTQDLTLTFNLNPPGEVRISLFGTTPLSGGGDLAFVQFSVVGELGEATPLNLTRGVFNEGAFSTLLDDGLFRVCDATDPDLDGLSACAGDCDNHNAAVRPGLAEICDMLDNDCDGTVDNAPVPAGSSTLSAGRVGSAARLSWTVLPGASAYDVVGGSLALLVPSGDFAAATDGCPADDLAATQLDVPGLPVPGNGFWYAVRGVNCGGAGSYDAAGAGQSASRDPGIAASPDACP